MPHVSLGLVKLIAMRRTAISASIVSRRRSNAPACCLLPGFDQTDEPFYEADEHVNYRDRPMIAAEKAQGTLPR
jgi:hypothetical protein